MVGRLFQLATGFCNRSKEAFATASLWRLLVVGWRLEFGGGWWVVDDWWLVVGGWSWRLEVGG